MALLETPICDFGTPAPPFRLLGIDNHEHDLESARGPNGLLVMFICNHCPYVQAIIDDLREECLALQPHGIGAIAIMPNDVARYPQDSFKNMKSFAAMHNLPFPYVIDESQEVARDYGAVCTPDFFGYNKDLKLQYRGRLNATKPNMPASTGKRELYEAMVAIAKTGHGPATQIPSMGCSIKWHEDA